ncbi:MAG: ATP-binding protein [bacterium]
MATSELPAPAPRPHGDDTAGGWAADSSGAHPGTREYFRRLRLRLKIFFLIAFIVPLLILSVYFHFQFNLTLKRSGELHLTTLAESQRNTVDLFLQERVVNIFNLFRSSGFNLSPSPDEMRRYLQYLREMSDTFLDVGFLDPSGIQIGYAGPYGYLQGKDYSGEEWVQALQAQSYYISGIYLGFRHKPHFTIAVRQVLDGRPFTMRATLDPDKFYLFLRTIAKGKGVSSALIDRNGIYQVVDPDEGEMLSPSGYSPPGQTGSGTHKVSGRNGTVLAAYAWLNEVPWVLVVRQPLRIAFAEMYRVRHIILIATLALALLLGTANWIMADRLMGRAERVETARRELKSQLLHAAKLVSVGELAAGVAHEINNPLAIIASQSGVIRDLLDPQFGLEWSPDHIRAELDQIDAAVYRARDITQKLLKSARKTEPRMMRCDVNQLLEDVVSGVIEKEFEVSDIELVRDYDTHLPKILLDPEQMRQVLLNMINNAGDALQGRSGTITLKTHHDSECVRVTIADTGVGMTSEQMEKIFRPFFTTKEVGKGTGLGLSISLSIIQSMGGRIEVQSMEGAGSSFTIVLPILQPEVRRDGG